MPKACGSETDSEEAVPITWTAGEFVEERPQDRVYRTGFWRTLRGIPFTAESKAARIRTMAARTEVTAHVSLAPTF
jgi:hypothetical protein